MGGKYAIFGGGMAGLSAAWKILETEPDARVDIFECGWRLGGKLQSSESVKEPENREHGLHILFGFYVNAFQLLYESYESLKDERSLRFRSLDEAIEPQRFGVVYDPEADESERQWLIRWPRDGQLPGRSVHVPGEWESLGDMVRVILKIAASLLPDGLARVYESGNAPKRSAPTAEVEVARWMRETSSVIADMQSGSDPSVRSSGKGSTTSENGRRRRGNDLKKVHDEMPEAPLDVSVRRARELVDIALGIADGLRRHVAQTGTWNIDSLDEYSLSAWLEMNGVSKAAANSAFIDMYREAAFGCRDGREDRPDFAAGAALRALIRIFSQFRGCVTWKLVGGAGECVVAPVFLAIRHLGARVHFFHRLEEIGWDDGRNSVFARVQRQADIKPGSDYEFLKNRSTGGVYWPDEPDYERLVNGDKLRAWDGRLEDPNQVVPDDVAPANCRDTFYAGPNQKYDKFILATGLGSLKAPDTAGHRVFRDTTARTEKLRQTIDELALVPTIAAQFALSKKSQLLGWTGDDASPGISGLPRPLPIACDMSQAGLNAGTYYLCSAYPLAIHHMSAEPIDDDEERDKIIARMIEWCESSGRYLSNRPAPDAKWDWNLLYDTLNREGAERMRGQYVRLNNLPVETCIGCHSGTNLRLLGPEDSGVPGLILAGAWTRTGMNLSSFEAAVMSGFRAARAATGARFDVPGEKFMAS